MRNLYLIAIVALLCACGKNPATEMTLAQVDSLMSFRPDSALILLEQITPKKVRGAEQRAYHALLLSQAYDKNYIDITNDSLIRIAHNYYNRANDIEKRALANYYLGQVQVNAGDSENATQSFLDAVKYGELTEDHYLLGLSHTQLGQMYEDQNLFPQAIEHYNDAFIEYTDADLPLHTTQSLIKIGNTYKLVGDHHNAINYYRRADTLARQLNDTIFLIEIGRNIGSVLYAQENFKAAKTHLLGVYEKYNRGSVPDFHADLFLMGAIYAKEGNIDQARYYFNRALNDDNAYNAAAIEYELHALESSDGNHAKALTHLRNHYDLVDSLHFVDQQQLILEIEEKYNTTQLEYENYKQKTIVRYTVIGAIMLALLLLAVAFYYYIRHRNKIRERDIRINSYLIALGEADRSLRMTSNVMNEKGHRLRELLESKFHFFRQYYDMAYSSQIRPEIRNKKINELLNAESIENETFALLKDIIEEKDPDFFKNLVQILPCLKESEINLLCLVLTGFSTEQMCAIYNTSYSQSIATKKYRLSLKMKEMIGKTLEEFTAGYSGIFSLSR